jgi:uncharacterized membrane protein
LVDNKVISEEMLNIIYIVSLIVVFILGIVSAYRLSKKEGFFSLESKPDYPFRESVGAFVGNGGMICFLVIVVINTVSSTSLFSFLGLPFKTRIFIITRSFLFFFRWPFSALRFPLFGECP